MMDSKVYILLPVHNRIKITLHFISLLKQQKYVNFILVLIDDGSVDGTAEAVCNQLSQTIVIKGKGNWWWAGCLHQGYKWIQKQKIFFSDIVLIINDDTEIKDDFIEKGISLLNNNKNSLIVAAAYDLQTNKLGNNGLIYDFKRNGSKQISKDAQLNCLSTRGLFLKATDFIKIGGFYPKLLPHYLSDYEFTMRAHRKGFNLICASELQIWFNNTTTGIHFINGKPKSYKEFIKIYFSKSYISNPIYNFNFYLLAFPFPYNIKHASIQLIKTIKVFLAFLKHNLSNCD